MIYTSTLSPNFFIERKNMSVEPIDNLIIPKVIVPSNLIKKRRPETKDTMATYIRQLLNSITIHNIEPAKKQLLFDIENKVKSEESLSEIATELLSSFIVSHKNLDNYVQILNAICLSSFRITNPVTKEVVASKSIGNIFLDKCRKLIFDSITEENIAAIADKYNIDDEDDFDIYNKEKEKISNLILLLCRLYSQRNGIYTKLTAIHVYGVISRILTNHIAVNEKMILLGNPYEGECLDEDKYEIYRRMCAIYAEQLYVFFATEGKNFKQDTTDVRGFKLRDLITTFYLDVIPNLSESHMQSKCKSLVFD
jgi:hypothetical protein